MAIHSSKDTDTEPYIAVCYDRCALRCKKETFRDSAGFLWEKAKRQKQWLASVFVLATVAIDDKAINQFEVQNWQHILPFCTARQVTRLSNGLQIYFTEGVYGRIIVSHKMNPSSWWHWIWPFAKGPRITVLAIHPINDDIRDILVLTVIDGFWPCLFIDFFADGFKKAFNQRSAAYIKLSTPSSLSFYVFLNTKCHFI